MLTNDLVIIASSNKKVYLLGHNQNVTLFI